ncbi:MAG: NUDIX domain-containing protein [bacterium]
MTKPSAGILLYRRRGETVEVFLVHPGGPFWAKKDEGAWSIPKGELSPGEDPLAAAKREFQEETGLSLQGALLPLTPVKLASGKLIHAWAMEGDCDPRAVRANTFVMEWPPRSGLKKEFPEIDRADWFPAGPALKKIGKGQIPFLLELQRLLQDEVQ